MAAPAIKDFSPHVYQHMFLSSTPEKLHCHVLVQRPQNKKLDTNAIIIKKTELKTIITLPFVDGQNTPGIEAFSVEIPGPLNDEFPDNHEIHVLVLDGTEIQHRAKVRSKDAEIGGG